MIKKFTQGDPKTDAKLYCLIGKMAINPAVHRELGVAVTGIGGDVWYLCLDKMGTVFGFCQVRMTKDKTTHIRFLYAEKLEIKIKNKLIDAVLTDAYKGESKLVFTNDRHTAGIWKLFNFVPGEKKRGTFVRWEKTL